MPTVRRLLDRVTRMPTVRRIKPFYACICALFAGLLITYKFMLSEPMNKRVLRTEGRQFFLEGKPFQILSGSIHYFRVVPEYWEDRLLKLKAMGLNTVQT